MGVDDNLRAQGDLTGHIEENIERVVAIQHREWEERSDSQRRVEHVSRIIGRPMYLMGLLAFTALWIAVNLGAPRFGWAAFDPLPFPFLDGVSSSNLLP